jgi:hypothetical protein
LLWSLVAGKILVTSDLYLFLVPQFQTCSGTPRLLLLLALPQGCSAFCQCRRRVNWVCRRVPCHRWSSNTDIWNVDSRTVWTDGRKTKKWIWLENLGRSGKCDPGKYKISKIS